MFSCWIEKNNAFWWQVTVIKTYEITKQTFFVNVGSRSILFSFFYTELMYTALHRSVLHEWSMIYSFWWIESHRALIHMISVRISTWVLLVGTLWNIPQYKNISLLIQTVVYVFQRQKWRCLTTKDAVRYYSLCVSYNSSSLIKNFRYVQKDWRAMTNFSCYLLIYDLRIFKVNTVYSQVLESLTLTKKACLVNL